MHFLLVTSCHKGTTTLIQHKVVIDKIAQLSYTELMRKITMRDFRWMGKPKAWEKDYRHLTLTVEKQMNLPSGPLLLAVSDDDFTCEITMSVPPQKIFSGLCAYHLDTNYVAVGISKDELEIHTTIAGYQNVCRIPKETEEESIVWVMKRRSGKVKIGYRSTSAETISWLGTFTLPGILDSLSFGPYFSNESDAESELSVYSVQYVKES